MPASESISPGDIRETETSVVLNYAPPPHSSRAAGDCRREPRVPFGHPGLCSTVRFADFGAFPEAFLKPPTLFVARDCPWSKRLPRSLTLPRKDEKG